MHYLIPMRFSAKLLIIILLIGVPIFLVSITSSSAASAVFSCGTAPGTSYVNGVPYYVQVTTKSTGASVWYAGFGSTIVECTTKSTFNTTPVKDTVISAPTVSLPKVTSGGKNPGDTKAALAASRKPCQGPLPKNAEWLAATPPDPPYVEDSGLPNNTVPSYGFPGDKPGCKIKCKTGYEWVNQGPDEVFPLYPCGFVPTSTLKISGEGAIALPITWKTLSIKTSSVNCGKCIKNTKDKPPVVLGDKDCFDDLPANAFWWANGKTIPTPSWTKGSKFPNYQHPKDNTDESCDFNCVSGYEWKQNKEGIAINNCEDLQNIKNNLSAKYYLADNIDCSNTENWSNGQGFEPIGSHLAQFKGLLDGNCYTISGLYINRAFKNRVGLFSYTALESVIRNLHMDNVQIIVNSRGDNGEYIGSKYPEDIGSVVGLSNSRIENVHVSGQLFTTAGVLWYGGLVGQNNGTIESSSFTGEIVPLGGDDNNRSARLGGLVSDNLGLIKNSYAEVNIIGKEGQTGTIVTIGGLVSLNNTNSKIENSYALGTIAGDARTSSLGGLAGEVALDSKGIINSYANIVSSGKIDSGGLIGFTTLGKDKIKNNYWVRVGNAKRCVGMGEQSGDCKEINSTELFGVNNPFYKDKTWDFVNIWKLTNTHPALKVTDKCGACVEKVEEVEEKECVWIKRISSGARHWSKIASSADGAKLVAIGDTEYIYTSIDGGITWTERISSGTKHWIEIASSADGIKLVAAVNNGYIYTSTDGGVTWVERTSAGSRYWDSIASSADGIKLVTVDGRVGYIYTSTDGGVTWVERTSAGSRLWEDVTSSADGIKLSAVVSKGYIYTSTDGGVTWVERTSAGAQYWNSIASSADGRKLTAISSSSIYVSIDGGTTWTKNTPEGIYSWWGIASSADGTKLAVVDRAGDGGNGGYIYTYNCPEVKPTEEKCVWIQRVSSGMHRWEGIVSSADGTKLAVTDVDGYIHTSTDSGKTWVEQTLPGVYYWHDLASSADGAKLALSVSRGYIHTSTDSGKTWVEQTSSGARHWNSIVSSADGAKLVAIINGGYIHTSTDSGKTWVEQTSSGARRWHDLASSADGAKLVAIPGMGYIHTSTDSGKTWVEQTSSGAHEWHDLASSADGAKLAVTDVNGYIYISTDSGKTWVEQTLPGGHHYDDIAFSADGAKLVAIVGNSYIHTSTDSGKTWVEQTLPGARNWGDLISSADGAKLVVTAYNDYIYTYNCPETQSTEKCQGSLPPNSAWWTDDNWIQGKSWANYQQPKSNVDSCGYKCKDGYEWKKTGPVVEKGIRIINCQELQDMNKDLTADYYLANNIDCTDTKNWNGGKGFDPIASKTPNKNRWFTGSFNGNYYTIKDLYINRPDESAGLFDVVGNAVKNNNPKSIVNVKLENVDITGGYYVGGLIGINIDAIVNNIFVSGNIGGINSGGVTSTGGIIGYSGRDNVISNSYFVGSLKGNNVNKGGIIGFSRSGSVHINNCYADVNITDAVSAGGLVGATYHGVVIENSYATGSISIKTSNNVSSSVGGLIGKIGYGKGEIFNSYAAIQISNATSIDTLGGLVGWSSFDNILIKNSSWATDVSGINNCIGKNDGQGTVDCTGVKESTFLNNNINKPMSSWDFGSIWITTDKHPMLKSILEFGQCKKIEQPVCQGSLPSNADWWNKENSPNRPPWYKYDSKDKVEANHQSSDIKLQSCDFKCAKDYVWNREQATKTGIAINDCEELQKIGNDKKYPLNGTYYLNNEDIDCSATNPNNAKNKGSIWDNGGLGFEPIGTINFPFLGKLHGNCFTIKNLYINRRDYVGLFGVLDSDEVSNLILQNFNIKGSDYVGSLAGYAIRKSDSAVSRVRVSGVVSGQKWVGGLVGLLLWGNISNSSFYGNVSSSEKYAGGLVGLIANGAIHACYSGGQVKGPYNVGGLTGSNGGLIDNSYSFSKVELSNINGGGFAGGNRGTITNSYSSGEVIGGYKIAGFSPDNFGKIKNSFSTGKVSSKDENADDYMAGFISENRGVLENNYWAANTSGVDYCVKDGSSDGCKKSDNTNFWSAKNKPMAGVWDFSTIWIYKGSNTFPVLRHDWPACGICVKKTGSGGVPGEGDTDSDSDTSTNTNTVSIGHIGIGSASYTANNNSTYRQLAGKIIMTPYANGETYYVSLTEPKVYYLDSAATAYRVMNEQGISITGANLKLIKPSYFAVGNITDTDTDGDGLPDSFEFSIGADPKNSDTDNDGYLDGIEHKTNNKINGSGTAGYSPSFTDKQKGKVLVDVSNGVAWYVNPKDGLRYYLGTQDAAYQVMKSAVGVDETTFNKLIKK